MRSQQRFEQSNLFGDLLEDSHLIEESMNKGSPNKETDNYQNKILNLAISPQKKKSKNRVVVYLTDEQYQLFRQKCFDLEMGYSNYVSNLIIRDLLKN